MKKIRPLKSTMQNTRRPILPAFKETVDEEVLEDLRAGRCMDLFSTIGTKRN